MEILPVGAESFHADGRTDEETDRHDKANSRSWNFCKRAYNHGYILYAFYILHSTFYIILYAFYICGLDR